jgi:MADS-box transcription factor
VNGETPVSALPSRFLTNELLPSPSSFYPDWNFRGGDSNTLPSPLNFATPVVGSGPSFLRDDNLNTTPNANSSVFKEPKEHSSNANGASTQNLSVGTSNSTATKRKTPEIGATAQSEATEESEAKRVRVE